jgi:hypothetical protein
MMDDKHQKRRTNLYGRYMHKIDRKVFTVTLQMKYRHIMEIVDEAYRENKSIYRNLKYEKDLQIEVIVLMKSMKILLISSLGWLLIMVD